MLKTKKRYDCAAGCPVELTLDLIGGKWKGVIVYHLLDATMRFNQLRRKLPTATQRMLTRQLRELEESGLVHREVFAQVPPRVDYSLTEQGRSLAPIILAMYDWGQRRLSHPRETIAA
jgi:DNA-binding HxlR family transcriptional regulator